MVVLALVAVPAYAVEKGTDLRTHAVYLFSQIKDRHFFDAAFARETYKTVESVAGIDELLYAIPDESWEAYSDWRKTVKRQPDDALEAIRAHPLAEDMMRAYDIITILNAWRSAYRGFPNYLMSYEQWQAQRMPDCTERPPGSTATDMCAPMPDWRSDEEKAADAKSFEKGNRARAAWKASPCKEIWDDRYSNSLEIRKKEWDTLGCENKLILIGRRKDPDR